MQDKRDQIRMGLLPPDAPKGKHLFVIARQPTHHVPSIYSATGQSYKSSNVGCRPRPHPSRGSCETQRKQGHETMNAERKLTDEQRRENLEAKKKRTVFMVWWTSTFSSCPSSQRIEALSLQGQDSE